MITQGGTINPVSIIEDVDLEENGGSYVIRQGAAVPVTRYATPERMVKQGTVTAVYIVTQAQVNAGEFTIRQGAANWPIFVIEDKPARGKTAVPVYITEDI